MTFKKWWKKKPHWLKGSLIGLLIAIPILLILSYYLLGAIAFLCIKDGNKVVLFYTDGAGDPLYNAPHCTNQEVFLAFLVREIILILITLISFFLLGAFIGWLVGKIKSKQ